MSQVSIDINCDLGESIFAADWENDSKLMPYISSANIACGGHAGNIESIKVSIVNSKKHDLKIGAHPSFPDKKNFGRAVMDISNTELRGSIRQQLELFKGIADKESSDVNHIKPHGALYNLAAKDKSFALVIAEEIARLSTDIKLMGLADSEMEQAAKSTGVEYISEAFMDRLYHENGTLVSREHLMAVHTSIDTCTEQALDLVLKKPIITFENTHKIINAQSICLHGDNPLAIEIAKALHVKLKQHNISIQ